MMEVNFTSGNRQTQNFMDSSNNPEGITEQELPESSVENEGDKTNSVSMMHQQEGKAMKNFMVS